MARRAKPSFTPPRGGWRLFEYRAGNCVGQTLAMLDIKVTLALTVREFDFKNEYEERGRMHSFSGIKNVYSERAYRVPQGAAHPVDGFPCKVTFTKKGDAA
jgi:hypothetical protein